MSLRIRKDGRILCAAMHKAESTDIYIDDRLHYELTVIHRVIVTEPHERHKEHGEWWWKNQVPDGIVIDKFYLKERKIDLSPHKTITMKVNASIDELVAPLVDALNVFDNIRTVDSCQGDGEKPAYVHFVYEGDEKNEPEFYHTIAQLIKKEVDERCNYEFRVYWVEGYFRPMAQIITSQEGIKILAESINAFNKSNYRT